jgi:anti-sigma factor RsiW
MEHEEFYLLMMDALDGELLADDQVMLESHLRACPSCAREWQTMLAIDTLFHRSPVLSPAAGFTQRTLARLPNRRVRLWAMGVIYITLLMSGSLPLLLLLGAALFLTPALREPNMINSLVQLLTEGLQLIGTIVGALLNGLWQLMVEQPSVLGWLLVMVGIVFLWSGVYRQLLNTPAQQRQQIF